jgi:hypothetical protein
MNHPYQVAFDAGHESSGLRMSSDGLAPSIDLAAGQFAARAYWLPQWFGETLDGIRMTLGLLNFIEPVVVHSKFLGWLDQAEVSL